jgi:hypothetical protein
MNEAQRQQLSQQFAEFAAKLERGTAPEDAERAVKILRERREAEAACAPVESAQLALPLL